MIWLCFSTTSGSAASAAAAACMLPDQSLDPVMMQSSVRSCARRGSESQMCGTCETLSEEQSKGQVLAIAGAEGGAAHSRSTDSFMAKQCSLSRHSCRQVVPAKSSSSAKMNASKMRPLVANLPADRPLSRATIVVGSHAGGSA